MQQHRAADRIVAIRDNLSRVIRGESDRLKLMVLALAAGGHVLIEGVPGVATTTVLPPLAIPGFRRHAHGVVLETVGWIAGNNMKFSSLLAGFGIIGRHKTSRRAILRTAITDQDFAFESLGCTGDVERLIKAKGACTPNQFAALGIERQ